MISFDLGGPLAAQVRCDNSLSIRSKRQPKDDRAKRVHSTRTHNTINYDNIRLCHTKMYKENQQQNALHNRNDRHWC